MSKYILTCIISTYPNFNSYIHATFRLSFNYMGCLPTNIEKLVLFHKRAARVILDITHKRHPSNVIFSNLKWMTVNERIDYRKCTLVYKSQTVWAHNISKICSHLCLRFMAATQDQLLIVVYMYHHVGTKKCIKAKFWI